MKRLNQTESPIFVILCVPCFQRQSFLTFIFICDLFVARDELEDLHADRTMICFTTMEAEGEGRDKASLSRTPRSNILLAVPRRYFRCGAFCLIV